MLMLMSQMSRSRTCAFTTPSIICRHRTAIGQLCEGIRWLKVLMRCSSAYSCNCRGQVDTISLQLRCVLEQCPWRHCSNSGLAYSVSQAQSCWWAALVHQQRVQLCK